MPNDAMAVIPSQHIARLVALTYPATMTAADAKRATDDLVDVQARRKTLEEAREAKLRPMREELDRWRRLYDAGLAIITAAEGRVKNAILRWREQEQATRARAAEEAAAAQALLAEADARNDAVAAGLSKDAANQIGQAVARSVQLQVTAEIAPAPLPSAVQGEAGTASVRTTWDFEIEDFSQVPREFLMPDDALIRAAIRKGARQITGIKIFPRESIVGRRR